MKIGYSYIYSFPFCGYTESENIRINTFKLNDRQIIRIYPPFRQGRANFIPMPHWDINKIPFIKKINHY